MTSEPHKLYIMYHATDACELVDGIVEDRLDASGPYDNQLGAGVYVTRNPKIAEEYGHYVFKLIVYMGRCYTVTEQNAPYQRTWLENRFHSAWIPNNCGAIKEDEEENCIGNPHHIKIMGLVRGEKHLPKGILEKVPSQPKVKPVAIESQNEWDVVHKLAAQLGISHNFEIMAPMNPMPPRTTYDFDEGYTIYPDDAMEEEDEIAIKKRKL